MDSLLLDIRFAWRSLRRTPGFTLTVVVMMALGIGVNSMIYSVLRAVLFAKLPFPEADRIVSIEPYDTREPGTAGHVPARLARRPRPQQDIDRGHDVHRDRLVHRRWRLPAAAYTATMASDALLSALQVKPLLGRWFTADDCKTGADIVPV
jgi:hypothetical protein